MYSFPVATCKQSVIANVEVSFLPPVLGYCFSSLEMFISSTPGPDSIPPKFLRTFSSSNGPNTIGGFNKSQMDSAHRDGPDMYTTREGPWVEPRPGCIKLSTGCDL